MANRKPMSPSQIAKLQEMLGASLRKANPFSDEAQDLIENHWDELEDELKVMCIAAINCVLEHMRNIIVNHVKVDRTWTPQWTSQQMLDALGRVKHTDSDVVKNMPRGQKDEEDVYFFWVGRVNSDDDMEAKYKSHGFVPADPYKVAAVNQNDPAFADEHPNVTYWKDAKGHWCYLACRLLGDMRSVSVYRSGGAQGDNLWLAGVRKQVA